MTGMQGMPDGQARFTFAIARHALVDLTQIFYGEPQRPEPDRLDHPTFQRLADALDALEMPFALDAEAAEANLKTLRNAYEPLAFASAAGSCSACHPGSRTRTTRTTGKSAPGTPSPLFDLRGMIAEDGP